MSTIALIVAIVIARQIFIYALDSYKLRQLEDHNATETDYLVRHHKK